MQPVTPPPILVADENAEFCDLVATALSAEGYQPHTVQTVESLLADLVEQQWALVLLDSLGRAPGDGIADLIEEVSAAAGETPILLMTGWSDNDLPPDASQLAGVIHKPFLLAPFLARIAEVVGQAWP